MFPILYESITAGQIPAHNGLGILTDCISCKVEQERNGKYELTMEYSISGLHAEEISERRIIKAKPNFTDNPQLFRIDRIGKTMNGVFTCYAKHISYDLSGYEITSGTASSATGACALLQSKANGYSITTDKTTSASFKITEPSSVRSWFAGKEGSFLDVFGGADIKYDNFNVQFLQNAGQNRGVTIRYGKNLLELSQETQDTLYTDVLCYWKSEDVIVTGDKVSTGLTLDVPKTLIIDCSQDYESAPSVTDLTNKATTYKNSHNLTSPSNNIKLDFAQSKELSERVDLCDTVSIYYEALGITRENVRCIRTVWDVIREKYTETEFGDAQATLASTMAVNNKKLSNVPTKSFMDEAINHATEMITGNLGGYVILHDSNGDGFPDEMLIMNTDDISTASQVWRWNKNGLGFATSYAGSYGTAITQDGKIVADYIATGTLNANLIKAGVISDVAGNSSIDMTSGIANLKDMKAKSSFSLVDSNNTNRGTLAYNNVGGTSFIEYNQNNKTGVVLSAGTTDGGMLRLYNPSGTQTLEAGNDGHITASGNITTSGNMSASGNISSSGRISADSFYNVHVKNTSSKTVVGLDATSTGEGNIAVSVSNGAEVAILNALAYGGNLVIKNTLGSSVVTAFSGQAYDGTINIYNSSSSNTINLSGNNGKVTCVSVTQTSSREVKKNIKSIEDSDKILKLQAVSFDYKQEEQGKDRRGFIAEDVAEVLPNLVTKASDDVPASLDYIGMIPYLQDIIKKQEARITELEKKIEKLYNADSKGE